MLENHEIEMMSGLELVGYAKGLRDVVANVNIGTGTVIRHGQQMHSEPCRCAKCGILIGYLSGAMRNGSIDLYCVEHGQERL